MKNEMIIYRSDDSEQIIISAAEKALEALGMYNGSTKVDTSYGLLSTLSDAVKRSNLILVLVTKSEYIMTKKIVSKSLGIELIKNLSVSKKLGKLAEDKEFLLHDSFPKGSVVLESKDNLYNGYYLKSGSQCIVFVPIDSVRTEGILEKTGIKLNIECSVKRSLRFVGVTKAQLENSVKQIGLAKSYSINDLRGELELAVEASASTQELAYNQIGLISSELKRIYKSRLYGVDCPLLANLVVGVLESESNQLAIADTENSMGIVNYLATDKRAGEWCKKVRLSATPVKVFGQNGISELVKKTRNKSGFELVVALGDEHFDEERQRDYIYGAFANEKGVLTKRFWKQTDEGSVEFRTRCAKELMLLVYDDRTDDEEYNNIKQNTLKTKSSKQERTVEKDLIVSKPVAENEAPDVFERKNRVAPKEDESVTRTKVIIMLVLVAVVIIISVLVSRGGDGTDSGVNNDVNDKQTTTTTTVAATTTLPSCDMCGKEIEGEVNVYVDEDGQEKRLCKQDYDFISEING